MTRTSRWIQGLFQDPAAELMLKSWLSLKLLERCFSSVLKVLTHHHKVPALNKSGSENQKCFQCVCESVPLRWTRNYYYYYFFCICSLCIRACMCVYVLFVCFFSAEPLLDQNTKPAPLTRLHLQFHNKNPQQTHTSLSLTSFLVTRQSEGHVCVVWFRCCCEDHSHTTFYLRAS